jgi:hypothetical protein
MQKSFQVLPVTITLSLILLTASVPVNHRSASPAWNGNTPVADGIPMPPPPKKGPGWGTVVADGIPMPPPPTKKPGAILAADGIPMPPPPTKKPGGFVQLSIQNS